MSDLTERIAILIVKYLDEDLSAEERDELQHWLDESEANQSLFHQLANEEVFQMELDELMQAKKTMSEKIKAGIEKANVIEIHSRNYWKTIISAAAVLLLICAGGYLWLKRDAAPVTISQNNIPVPGNDVPPGADRATLTLSDGSVVVLDTAQNGVVATQHGIRLVKSQDNQLQYQSAVSHTQVLPDNIISTPRGGQYHVVLSDGTNVWLNAASSISYPVAFTPGAPRKVVVTGEVYFEVATVLSANGKGKLPFSVKKGEMEVSVLGTHFNVNTYEDEGDLKVTLLEGLVKVSSSGNHPVFIRPGQQAMVHSTSSPIEVRNDISTDEIMAWKNGLFRFQSASIESIMRQVARWYDVDVVYGNQKITDKFSGKISRQVNLSGLLKILTLSGIHCTIEGKKLSITK